MPADLDRLLSILEHEGAAARNTARSLEVWRKLKEIADYEDDAGRAAYRARLRAMYPQPARKPRAKRAA